MARPKMNGLRYFPLDADIFDEVALRRLRCAYGNDMLAYKLYLTCKIHGKEGYYVRYDEDLLEAASMDLNVETDKLREMTDAMVMKKLFDPDLYWEKGALTSLDIQLRYQEACRSFRRKIYVDRSLWLVDEAYTANFICFIGESRPGSGADEGEGETCGELQLDDSSASDLAAGIQTDRSFRGKESKENEIKANESRVNESKVYERKEEETGIKKTLSFVCRPSEADKTKDKEKRENERGETEKNGGVFPVSSDNGGNMKAAPAVESPELFFLTEEEKRTIDRRDAEGIAEIVKRVKNEAPNRFSRLRQYFWKAGITAWCYEDGVRVIC